MLTIKQARKTFFPGTPNEVAALQGIDLTIEPGSFVVVIGTNGSGKSTLLNAVAGTFFLDSGSISIDDVDVTDWPEHARAAFIGRVFQNPFSGTAPNMSIAENFALAARRGNSHGLGWALKRSLMDQFRQTVRGLNMGLENRLDNPIGTLSGGQRQALTLLMATWIKPKLLLLDEHTAALDPRSADQVIRLSDQIIKRDKLTTMMVTHSMHQAASLGDRLIMVHRGQIVRDIHGEQKQQLHPDELLEIFNEIRRLEQLDENAAEFLQQAYC